MIDVFAILVTSVLALFVAIRAASLDARDRSEMRERGFSSRVPEED